MKTIYVMSVTSLFIGLGFVIVWVRIKYKARKRRMAIKQIHRILNHVRVYEEHDRGHGKADELLQDVLRMINSHGIDTTDFGVENLEALKAIFEKSKKAFDKHNPVQI